MWEGGGRRKREEGRGKNGFGGSGAVEGCSGDLERFQHYESFQHYRQNRQA